MRIRFTTACYPACGDDRKYDDLHHGLLALVRTTSRAAVVRLLTIGLIACDVDLFGTDRRPLVGPYGIFVHEGTFFLVLESIEMPCELLGDAIYQIGWNDRLILAQLEPRVGEGPPSGWRLVHVETKTIETLTEQQARTGPDLAGLKLLRAQDAWSR